MLQESFIKHGKIYPLHGKGHGNTPSHLDPIQHHIKRGICDAKESITLQPKACDVKGAKRFNGQSCVIAKALKRVLHPQAVAVGRTLAYVVVDGLAVRFSVPAASRKLIEEFDTRGKASLAPVELRRISKSWEIKNNRGTNQPPRKRGGGKRKRMKHYEVRAIGGGVSA